MIWTKQLSGLSVEAVSLDTAPGISVPLFLIKPNSASAGRMPVVLAFAQGGKEAFLNAATQRYCSAAGQRVSPSVWSMCEEPERLRRTICPSTGRGNLDHVLGGNGINARHNRAGPTFEGCSHGGALSDEPQRYRFEKSVSLGRLIRSDKPARRIARSEHRPAGPVLK